MNVEEFTNIAIYVSYIYIIEILLNFMIYFIKILYNMIIRDINYFLIFLFFI
ncbi:hypothetical protein MYSEV_273 [Mythimna separata entomopoxvirus 'L']|uniref:Uncharacterized protein n=1 Tax=Mythimna separata entomopoxvirus 'L' TaxID=1293572 RepID=A0A916P7P8_9POXV|nr:hypothetical protein MYSEV_273 [Mythimna separata entomopoxvirus 'L']CCU56471.1 hypothetical protein MYSEV_273 [Mythimna separata entomopoxvirus 'L']